MGVMPPQAFLVASDVKAYQSWIVLATVCISGNQCAALPFVTDIILSPLSAHFLVMQHSYTAGKMQGNGDLQTTMLQLMKLTGKKQKTIILYQKLFGYAAA